MHESQLEESKALHEFTKVLHNTTTKNHYMAHLRKYQKWTKIDYDQLVNRDIEVIQPELEKYLELLQQEEGHSKAYIKLAFAGITLFYGMNNKIVNKIRLQKMVKPQEDITHLEAYTTDDILQILETIPISKLRKHPRFKLTRLRLETAIYFLSASGCRIGGMTSIKVKDLEKIEDCYCVKVYANSKEEYLTFLTPQASKVLDQWLEYRQKAFKINGDNPRNPTDEEFLEWHLFDLDRWSMYLSIQRLVKKSQVRYERKGRQYLKPVHHAFRYRFNTIAKSNPTVNPVLVERLLGHSTSIALDKHYLKPTREQLFAEYRKIIKELSLN